MKRDIPMKGGGEYDALTGARKWYSWKPGQLKAIKRGFNKRERHTQKQKNRRERDA